MDLQTTLYIMGYLVLLVLLAGTEALPHQKSSYTTLELKRRQKNGDKTAGVLLDRDKQLTNILTVRLFLYIIVLLGLVVLGSSQFGYLGILLAVALALTAHIASGWSFTVRLVEKLYNKYEQHINVALTKIQPGLQLFYGSYKTKQKDFVLHSPDELKDILKQTEDVLSVNQKHMLLASLRFEEKTVAQIMTPRKEIKTIDKKELLGPLTLDDLHKLGHKHIPATNRGLDHIVGILRVDDVLTINSKQSATVEQAMQLPALYIFKDTNLLQTAAAFLHTGSPLFIVVDESKKTVGLVSLSDLVEAMVGKAPTDNFSAYDDIQAVIDKIQTKVQ